MGTIGIIGAMEVEVKELKEQMQITRQLTKAGMEFCEGILEGQDVVVVRSGVGKVNAAVCTQILIDVFDVKAVINTGIAGSLKAEINIGDLVISSDLVHHDMDAVSFGYPKGQIPQMDVFSFEADKALADLAEKVCEEVNPEIQVFHGRVVSGDQFIADKETKENISTLFAGYCTPIWPGWTFGTMAWTGRSCGTLCAIRPGWPRTTGPSSAPTARGTASSG